ncbi:hypothetical protein [Streptomyces sp. NPDC091268]|uniref:hypothetical protein n=1 Tax=Streptomyces sp. NPDC091268 TaxID=3365979 RepID=UPI00380FDBA0
MRTASARLATAAALLTAVLATTGAANAAASPTPPSPDYKIGTALDRNIDGMPYCPVGYGFVIIDHDRAVLVEGSGSFIADVLHPGQTIDDAQGGTLTFHRDGKSITYNDYAHHGGRPVTEVCKPHP